LPAITFAGHHVDQIGDTAADVQCDLVLVLFLGELLRHDTDGIPGTAGLGDAELVAVRQRRRRERRDKNRDQRNY
jgi:hypothetical protein